jgi:hypothetical protein
MKVLMLSRYERLGASSRMRFYQYLPWLEAAGISITMAPLFSDAYVQGLQRNTKSPLDALRAYAGRVQALLASREFDLLWIEKETLPWLPAWVEKMLLPGAVPYVLDYDDAVFHYYDENRNPVVKALLAGKHPALMQGAALVVAGNVYLAEFARQAGAPHVEVVPTVIDLARYPLAPRKRAVGDTLPCVGWIGQRATASFLAPYAPIFERLSAEGLARFAAIGIDAKSLGLPMDSIPWVEATEVDSISSCDIGIMPLVDEPFERGKCGYKLIQYMACGLPVVASPVGVNRQIVEHGVNGFLAETPEQWEQALRTLLANPELRQRMGQAGRQKFERQYCIQVTGPTLARLLIEAAKK